MEDRKELPEGWKWVKLGEVVKIVSGNTPKGIEDYKGREGNLPFFKVGDMNREGNDVFLKNTPISVDEDGIARLKIKTFPKGTVVFPKRGGAILTNKKRILFSESTFDLNLMGLIPGKELKTSFLFYWIQLLNLGKIYDGSNVPQINNKNIEPLLFPLPPIEAQHLIVSKIEELFSELDHGVAQLKQVKQQLKVYRQAVLKWIVDEASANNSKEITLREVLSVIEQGWSPKCENRVAGKSEWGVIKTSAVQEGRFVEEENKLFPLSLEPRKKLEIKKGDILITRAGPRSRVGICCLVGNVRSQLIVCDKVYRMRSKDSIMPEFIELLLNSPRYKSLIEEMKSGISDSGLNLTQGKFLSLKLPDLDLPRQKDLLAKYEAATSHLIQLEAEIEASQEKAESFRQSILKKAFEGELCNNDKI